MASYPGAVKSFTTRNAGDVIQPSHTNDLQDEVNAIESGLLQGTAPLNSSNSTVVNLSVTGNSTIGGSLTVTGALSIANLTPTGTATANAQPRCRVFHGSTQTLSSAGETTLTFDSEDFDVGGLHSTATNPTRITPGSTGIWMFGATVASRAISLGNTLQVRFIKNSTTAMGSYGGGNWGGVNSYPTQIVIDQISATTDWVEVRAIQNTLTALESGNASSRVDQNQFWAVKLW